jgi:hypothetical protein
MVRVAFSPRAATIKSNVEDMYMADNQGLMPVNSDPPPEAESDDDALLSTERFDDALSALEDSAGQEELSEDEAETAEPVEDRRAYSPDESDMAAPPGTGLADVDEEDRLRQPRAQLFRRRLRNQINMLPLALYVLALGGFLLARQQDVAGLPDLSALAISVISVLVLASTLVFRSLLGGRQERGLLMLGLWVWIAAGMLLALVYGIEPEPDAKEWWPLILGSLGATFIVMYPVERTHDTRLIWLGIVTLVAGGVAYAMTSDLINERDFKDAADYWPLLLAVIGVGVLPLAFRRRTG